MLNLVQRAHSDRHSLILHQHPQLAFPPAELLQGWVLVTLESHKKPLTSREPLQKSKAGGGGVDWSHLFHFLRLLGAHNTLQIKCSQHFWIYEVEKQCVVL